VTGFLGAEWEYEFDGQANGRMDGERIDEFSLKGHSGLAKAGIAYQATDNFSLALSAHGATGERKGGGGTLSLNFSF